MYKSYKLLTMTVNMKGGDSEEVEHLYKEVDGNLVPCTKEEAIFKMLSKTATVGGNPSTKAIKAYLINPSGNVEKTEEVIKEATE